MLCFRVSEIRLAEGTGSLKSYFPCYVIDVYRMCFLENILNITVCLIEGLEHGCTALAAMLVSPSISSLPWDQGVIDKNDSRDTRYNYDTEKTAPRCLRK